MRMGKFFPSGSQIGKRLEPHTFSNSSTTAAEPQFIKKNNGVSFVEHQFRRMSEAHDRIRTAVFASRSQDRR